MKFTLLEISNEPYLSYQAVCHMTKKSRQKFRINKKHFSSFLKGFQLPKIASDLKVRL